jgi:short-subunit dehydrogenase
MHILVTGASSGIGAALARELATLPEARLTLVARRRPLLEELAASLAAPCHLEARDLAETPLSTDWLERAIDSNGPIDVLVNNAGVQLIGPTAAIDVAAGERSIAVNLLAPLRLIRAALPAMIERRRGHIVNIASMAALAPTPTMTYYNASKGGLAAASEALRGELRGTGVGVVTVYPGIIGETEMAEKAVARYRSSRLLELQPNGTAAELARRVRAALERDHPRVIYPRANTLARWFPAPTRWLMDRFTPDLTSP